MGNLTEWFFSLYELSEERWHLERRHINVRMLNLLIIVIQKNFKWNNNKEGICRKKLNYKLSWPSFKHRKMLEKFETLFPYQLKSLFVIIYAESITYTQHKMLMHHWNIINNSDDLIIVHHVSKYRHHCRWGWNNEKGITNYRDFDVNLKLHDMDFVMQPTSSMTNHKQSIICSKNQ